jgi:LacI family transcriptional regulator, gluconate utilization system Gnt-I transcriptional repressor
MTALSTEWNRAACQKFFGLNESIDPKRFWWEKGGMKMPKKNVSGRATLNDVAAIAQVSAVTVSRVLRRPEMVSPELRERVGKAVRELAYIPNQMASALASSRTGRIGVIVPSFTNGVFGDFLQGIHDLMVPAGFQVVMLNSNYMAGQEESAIISMLGQFPEAIILTGVGQTRQARKALEQSGIPVVQTLEVTDTPIDINIGLSQTAAGFAAAKHLLDLGHRQLCAISAPHDSRSLQRLMGYRQAAADRGAVAHIVSVDEPSSIPLGAKLLNDLLTKYPATTAIFSGNDTLALGALFECQRRGIRVPGDVSIMGFNDLDLAESAYPSITSVATPRYEMGHMAAEIILEIVRGSGQRPTQNRLDLGFKLIQRESTAPLAS